MPCELTHVAPCSRSPVKPSRSVSLRARLKGPLARLSGRRSTSPTGSSSLQRCGELGPSALSAYRSASSSNSLGSFSGLWTRPNSLGCEPGAARTRRRPMVFPCTSVTCSRGGGPSRIGPATAARMHAVAADLEAGGPGRDPDLPAEIGLAPDGDDRPVGGDGRLVLRQEAPVMLGHGLGRVLDGVARPGRQ